jgi:hypothetical protein
MKKIVDTKKLLFESMVKLNPDFKLKEEFSSMNLPTVPMEEDVYDLIQRAIRNGFITLEEFNADKNNFISAASETADSWSDREEIGSSDMTFMMKEFLYLAGIETEFVNNRLTRKNKSLDEKDDKWIQKAVNPEHKGYCTPMTKPTCTPARKALAKRFKKGIEDESYGTPDPLGTNMAKQVSEDTKILRTHDVLNNFNKAVNDFYAQLIADRVEPKEAIGHITQNFNMIIKGLQ